jgi:hypothetical protein
MKRFEIALTFIPLIALVIAASTELRFGRNWPAKLSSITPILFGLAAFGISIRPDMLPHATPDSIYLLSRIMTLFSACIACSGVFINYSRKSSAILVAFAGLLLAYM